MAKLLLAFALCLVLVNVNGQVDDCDPIVIDECGFKMYDQLMSPARIPQNQDELDAYCKDLKDGQECLKERLKKCPSLFPASLANSYIDSVGYSYDDICKSGGKDLGKKMLEHTPCIKEKLSDSCTKDFFKKVQAAPYEEQPEQMEAVCCAFLKFDRCYNDAVKESCGKKAGREVRSAIQGFGIFLVDKCLPYLSEPEKCNQRVAKSLPADAPEYKSILPSVALVFLNDVQKDKS